MTAAVAPPIVFVHGTRFSAGQWSSQLAALRGEYQVAAVDLPGHGARSGQPWSLTSATEIIASAALEFARRCPGRLRGLVLAGASACELR